MSSDEPPRVDLEHHVEAELRAVRELLEERLRTVQLSVSTGLEDIRSLRDSRSVQAGQASQNSVNIAYAISGVSLLLGIAGIVLHFVR